MIEVKSTLGLYSPRRDRPGGAPWRSGSRRSRSPGEQVFLPPEHYNAFFRSLVHVFRNAVDHGLEAPEDRVAAGKPEEGRITCAVRARRDQVEILVTDDGGRHRPGRT